MASKTHLPALAITAAVVLGGLYLYNQSKGKNVAQDYSSGVTGQTIEEATQPTIRTDLRQSARTQRATGRQQVKITRSDNRTARAIGRQAVRINRADEKTSRVQIRQDSRSNRVQARQSARTQRVQARQSARTERQRVVVASVRRAGNFVIARATEAKNRLRRNKNG